MTMVSLSSPNNRERVDLARSVVGGIFPVGQAVVVRIPKSGNSISHNPPAISIRYYQSPMSSQDGPLAGIERQRLLCAFPASPFTDAMRDFRVGLLNLGGAIGLHSLFRAPIQACKQAARVFHVLFGDGSPSLQARLAAATGEAGRAANE